MKKIYLILLCSFWALHMRSQLVLTYAANAPVVGDVTNYANYDSTTAVPKLTGSGVSWNFTSLAAGSFTENITYTTVASTPSGSNFSSCNLVLSRGGGNNFEYYNSSPSTLAFYGFVDQGGSSKVVFSNSGTWMSWPLAIGNSITDNFAASEIASTYTNSWTGNFTVTAAGSGTVTMPNGAKHNNCLLVTRSITVGVTGTSSYSIQIMQYHYYSASSKQPIMMVEYQTQKTGTMVSSDINIMAEIPAMVVGMPQSEVIASSLVYPNPGRGILNVTAAGNQAIMELDLLDINGRMISRTVNSDKLDVTAFDAGVYFLRIVTANATEVKRLVLIE